MRVLWLIIVSCLVLRAAVALVRAVSCARFNRMLRQDAPTVRDVAIVSGALYGRSLSAMPTPSPAPARGGEHRRTA